MKLLLLTLAVLLLLAQLSPGDGQRCWNSHGKCHRRCSRKDKVYIYCSNGKVCCVKPKYQVKERPWIFSVPADQTPGRSRRSLH
ncbi:beta-defensin 36-like [Perognathus longimembris pacificus]|uniref:beta-defensin 36-like n=1 Tax=Perognathus longimembris pacificus TaxID=214514 RepID=UPI0020192AF1|nr:beta-defensin 36-like [Perognathus longimembris pacificus]